MINGTISFFDKLMRRYTPDPFVLAIILSLTVFFMAFGMTDIHLDDLILSWGEGFWALTPFTMQMVMILIGGYVLAMTPPVHRLLKRLAQTAKTPQQAVVVLTITAMSGCLLNWGLGLVMGALLCREMLMAHPKVNFRLLVASAYSGFLVFHGGLSGSIPLVIATPGNFTEKYIGGLIPATETLLSPLNLAAVGGLCLLIPLTNWFMGRMTKTESTVVMAHTFEKDMAHFEEELQPTVPVEWLEKTRYISFPMGVFGMVYLVVALFKQKAALDLNTITLLLIVLSLLLHKSMWTFLEAVNEGAKKCGPILIQFPLYASIGGMMMKSGLGDVLSQAFVRVSTPESYGLLTFYSAGFLNLFIPSGGGQWAVQGPIVLQSAKELGVDFKTAAMAVAWGDAWTNMLQPFWALPVLAISGLKIRDIMGYCLGLLVVTGVYLSLVFWIFG